MELARHYSNQPQLLDDLRQAAKQLRSELAPERDATPLLASAGPSQRPRLVSSRLSEDDITNLIAAYRAGASTAELATRFGIGATTVKKLLRERRCRRKDLPDGWDFLRRNAAT